MENNKVTREASNEYNFLDDQTRHSECYVTGVYSECMEEDQDYGEYPEYDDYDDKYGECYVPGVYAECDARDQDYGEYTEHNDYSDNSSYDEYDEAYGESYDEYTEADYGEIYDDKYGECYVPGVYSECDARDQDYGEHTDTSGGGGSGSGTEGKYKILDLVNSKFAMDNVVFTYIIEDRSYKTMIASTSQEEYFVHVKTTAGYEKIKGEYYVTSANSVKVISVVRVIDYMREQYPAAADGDVYYSSAFSGVLALDNGVFLYTQPNQVTCKGMTYVNQPSEAYIQTFVKVKQVIEKKAGKILDILYDSDTTRTIVKCQGEKIYRADVENAVFYKDERYALSESYVSVVELRPAVQMIMEQFHAAQADIVVHSDRITFTDNNGVMYKVFFNDLPDYYEYDYDYYVPANATIVAEVDYTDAPAIPANYVRVVKEIQRITGVTDVSQDDNYVIHFYGKKVYVPGAVRFGGWVYASPQMVVSALTSNFVDINDYLHSCGFYYGTDDDGNSYDAFVYKSQTTWLLGKVITIANRFRVNSSYGYYNLTVSAEMIENAVRTVFGVTAQVLGESALEKKTLKSYFESDLYIQKARVRTEGGYLSINGKSFLLSNVQRKFGGSYYFDKTKLLTAVKSLTPDIIINEIATVLPDDEQYAFIAGNKVRLRLSPRELDHMAIGVVVNGETTWYENSLEGDHSEIEMEIPLLQPGDCTLKLRGRTTMDPAVVGKDIPYSKEVEKQREITVLAAIPDDCVYIEPYARANKCTTELYSDYLKVFYQHPSYSQPEKCTYYKSKINPGPYERVCSYTNDGLYIEKKTFRMDMDFDIETDPHKDRDWYLHKRVWRLQSQGKVASFSEEKTESGATRAAGKKYYDVVLNNVSRKIYKVPVENAFYKEGMGAAGDRPSIRNENGKLVCVNSQMEKVYKYGTPVRDYIESHYKMYNPSSSLSGSGESITLFGKPLVIDCAMINETWKNSSNPEEIERGMGVYFNTYLKNVYDALPEKLKGLFHYTPAADAKEVGKISFDGFEVGIPASLITKSTEEVNPNNYANMTEYAKDALYATQADINRICRYRRIVVYGGGFGGFCAAYKAAQYAWSLGDDFMNFEIFLINPVPTPKLGGIGTVGGQNFWDTRRWNGKFPYRGTLEMLMDVKNGELQEDRYNIDEKAAKMKRLLEDYGVNIFYQEDITDVEQATDGKITSVTVRTIKRNSNDDVVYVGGEVVIHGDVFIDASEDGKLTRLTAKNVTGRKAVTKGRYDYPAKIVQSEDGSGLDAKQPAVSLMFKLKTTGIEATESNVDIRHVDDDDSKEINCFNCGRDSFSAQGTKMYAFNEKYKNTRFLIKPVNSAWNGGEELYEKDANGEIKRYTTWWLNSLLIFGVDGTMHKRDMTPADASSSYLSTDEAWKQARQFLEEHSSELLEVYRSLGYNDAEFVRDDQGKIVTGDILYVRETIHAVKDTNAIANGTENQNYEVTRDHCHYADQQADNPINPQSIGLVYYWSDIHPFKKEDCLDNNGIYIWGAKSCAKIRWDMVDKEHPLDDGSPKEPAYIPYKALTTQYVPNLLIPGYAVSAGSFAWSEIRVFPNLCVLGDAAGIAAVTSLLSGDPVCSLSDVQGVRAILRQYNAILDRSEV